MSKETGQGSPKGEPKFQEPTYGGRHIEVAANKGSYSFFRCLNKCFKESQIFPKQELTAETASELVKREQEEWKRVLGTTVEVKPVPEIVTPRVIKKLEKLGFGLRYVPSLELGAIDDIKSKGVTEYLKQLELKIPNWKRYETFSIYELREHDLTRNLGEWYWTLVRDGEVDFPALPGQWMGVETVKKRPNYSRTHLAKKLKLHDEFDYGYDTKFYSYNEIRDTIKEKKPWLLAKTGLSEDTADVRLLEALEKNLLSNRENWGRDNDNMIFRDRSNWNNPYLGEWYEWTNTERRGGTFNDGVDIIKVRQRLVVGGCGGGSPKDIGSINRNYGHGVSFRLAIVFRS